MIPPVTAPRILVVSHSRTGSTAELRDALCAGLAEGAPGADVVVRDATEAGLDDLAPADAVVFATPARFGGLAGLTRDFLERIYPWFEERPDVRPGLPWSAVVKGASDPSGAVRDLERILTGLRWKPVLPPLQVTGEVTAAARAAAHELGATLAAGLDAGLW